MTAPFGIAIRGGALVAASDRYRVDFGIRDGRIAGCVEGHFKRIGGQGP